MNRLLSTLLVCLLQVSLALASTFNLKVEVTPDGSGSLNTSGGTYEEGSSIYLRTYNHTGFVFKGWFEGEKLLSSSTGFNFTMPANDAVVQARYEYDPGVPANPAMPDTTTYYTLTASVSPLDAGYLNTTSGKYAAGASAYLRTYGNTGFQFIGWQNEKGVTVSTSTSFSYQMPSSNSKLTAIYTYDPSVPANPDSMATRYTVSVSCKPAGSGSFNTSNATVEEGGSVHLYAYTNTGFQFQHWEDANGNVISSEQNFYYVMPHGNTKIYGVFEYNPSNPSNPGKNYWNKEIGEVIVDDFAAGSLSSAMSTAISGSNKTDVTMIIVSGRINNNDLGVTNDYTNCSLLDLSRVAGVSEVPSYAFDYTNLETVYLPATIEKIGYRAFAECGSLSALTCYAMTPPTLEQDVFVNIPEGLVVYVPSASIAQYQDADGWKNFTILPIQEDIRSLAVNMPDGTDMNSFQQMWLELINTKSGQKLHYILTDRTSYTFRNLIRNTSWNVVLRNQGGDVFGRIDNVEVKDEDVAVTFSELCHPQNVKLQVVTPDGNDVTSEATIAWMDSDGNYLSKGSGLQGLLSGTKVSYSITLPRDLALRYVSPGKIGYTVSENENDIAYLLKPVGKVLLTGKVKDMATGSCLSNVAVSASQTFAGKYNKTVTAKTDANGLYSISVSAVPTSLSFSATDYISQTVDCDSAIYSKDSVALADVSMKTISGSVISLNFTYTPSVKEGETAETQNWYSDYNNVSYNIKNKTRGKRITQFNLQYPQIVLLEEVDEGDVLELTATSRTSAFNAVTTETTIAEQKAIATFDVFELGKISASFANNANASVVGTLYDSKGKLVKTYDYSNGNLTIDELADGDYTLVTMGGSRLFNSVYDLSQLPQTGIVQGTDYVQNSVTVKSGVISTISIENVPTLDETKFYYIGDNTSFTVNKASVVSGNYLTLTSKIDFKSAYSASVSNVNLIVDLPESCSFVENSVMVGNALGSYSLQGNRITIPMEYHTDRVRFCIIPTLSGEYAPSALVQFDIDGETITQPIGSANYTAKDLSINVPSTVAKTSIPVNGTAIGVCNVEIYDNDVLIGQAKSLANGQWNTTCDLDEPYNLSTHSIYAKVTTKTGLELQTETKSCQYDKNAIEVKTVTMINTAHTASNLDLHDYVTVFDFQDPKESYPAYWYWPSYPDFTFLVDFTNNDTAFVRDVTLYVFTDDNQVVTLYPTYDEKIDKYVVKEKFYSNSLPYNVSVDFTSDTQKYIDAKKLTDDADAIEKLSTEFKADWNKLNSLLAAFTDSISEADYKAVCQSMGIEYNEVLPNDSIEFSGWTQDMIEEYLDSCAQDAQCFMDSLKQVVLGYEGWLTLPSQFENTFGTNALYSMRDCSGLTPGGLLAQGYESLETTDGYDIYILTTDSVVTYVNFEKNVCISIRFPKDGNRANVKSKALLSETFHEVYENIAQAREIVSTIYADFLKRIMLPQKALESQVKSLEKSISKYERNLGMCKNGSTRWKYWNGVIKDARKTLSATKTALKYIGPFLRFLARCVPIADYLVTLDNCWSKASELASLYITIPDPCPNDQANANWCKAEDIGIAVGIGALAITDVVLEITGDVEIAVGAAGSLASAGTSLAAAGWGIVQKVAAQIGKFGVSKLLEGPAIAHLRKKIANLKCYKKDPPTPKNPPTPPGGGSPNVKDPSGYVYEGVSNNRLEGVTATAYYKETVEDMYGDKHENIVKWDAAEYAQENPLFTDEYGMYAWDVPNGLWQVKFEKEGYETTYSDWLPVPPPQLDINIPMKSNVQPNVKDAHAYEDAVEVEFDKFMMSELLTKENVHVLQAGTLVDGTVQLLNEDVSYEGNTDTYASKVRFTAAKPFDACQVTLVVSNRVKSYAGIRMQDDYSQSFAIEQEVRSINCDSVLKVNYGDSKSLTVQVLPAAASTGKTLVVRSSSSLIVSLDKTETTIDEDGKAVFNVTGVLPGTAGLTFSIDGYDITATTIVNVENEVQTVVTPPVASIASGSVVVKGTEVSLATAEKNAKIYYTLDGSCPCETISRILYEKPIIINEDVTIKAITLAPDDSESEVVTFVYTINKESGIKEVNSDDLVIGNILAIYNLNGIKMSVNNITKLEKGIYIILTETNGKISYVKHVKN